MRPLFRRQLFTGPDSDRSGDGSQSSMAQTTTATALQSAKERGATKVMGAPSAWSVQGRTCQGRLGGPDRPPAQHWPDDDRHVLRAQGARREARRESLQPRYREAATPCRGRRIGPDRSTPPNAFRAVTSWGRRDRDDTDHRGDRRGLRRNGRWNFPTSRSHPRGHAGAACLVLDLPNFAVEAVPLGPGLLEGAERLEALALDGAAPHRVVDGRELRPQPVRPVLESRGHEGRSRLRVACGRDPCAPVVLAASRGRFRFGVVEPALVRGRFRASAGAGRRRAGRLGGQRGGRRQGSDRKSPAVAQIVVRVDPRLLVRRNRGPGGPVPAARRRRAASGRPPPRRGAEPWRRGRARTRGGDDGWSSADHRSGPAAAGVNFCTRRPSSVSPTKRSPRESMARLWGDSN